MTPGFFDYETSGAPPPGRTPEPAVGSRLLADLAEDDWEKLASFAARRRYAAGATIMSPAADDPALVIIVTGRVRVSGAGGGAVTELGPGDVFGAQAFIERVTPATTATAAEAVQVLVLTGTTFDQFAAWHPRIALLVLRTVAAHVSARLRRFETLP